MDHIAQFRVLNPSQWPCISVYPQSLFYCITRKKSKFGQTTNVTPSKPLVQLSSQPFIFIEGVVDLEVELLKGF